MGKSDSEIFHFKTAYDDQPVSEQTIPEVLRNRAEQIGDRPLVYYGPTDEEVTYSEMTGSANAIGNTLQEFGVEKGENVSVMLGNSLQTMKAFYGIVSVGAVYSPINIEYKGDMLEYQLNDTDPEILLLDDEYLDRMTDVADELDTDPHVFVRDTGADTEDIDGFDTTPLARLFEGDSEAPPDVELSWNDDASIIYTSGTTGWPKGCVCSHRYWTAGLCLTFGQILEENDVVHNSLPLHHIAGVGMVLIPMVAGAAASMWERFSPNDFWDRIDEYESTYTLLLSVMIPWITNAPEQDDDDKNTLKMAIMQPVPENWQAIANRFGIEVVPMMYSQTEAAVPLSGFVHAEGGKPEEWIKGVHPDDILRKVEEMNMPLLEDIPGDRFMGQPIQSVAEGKIVDPKTGEALPPGDVGELVLRPKQEGIFMKEYYNKPERTRETFRDGWLHTGDAAYRDEDGNYFFVDRIGDVIRRRGENISSLQIQDAVNSNDAVEQAAVFPVPAPEGGEDQIGCAVQVAKEEDLDAEALRSHLTDRLPDFYLPDHIRFYDVLPTTETDKVEKYKLREEFTEQIQTQND